MSSLFSDVRTYTLANIAARATAMIALLVLPLLLGLGDYGVIGLVIATSAFVNIIVPFEVSQGLARFYATASDGDKATLASTAWWFTITMLVAAALVALAFAERLSALLFGSPGLALPFAIATVFWLANTAFLFLQNQFRWNFDVRSYTIYTLLFAVSTLAAAIVLASVASSPLIGAITGWAVAAGMVTLLATVRLRRMIWVRPTAAALRRMLGFSWPLVPASVAILLTTYFSRVAIGDLLSLREVGLFTFASQLAAIPSFVILGLQSALTPYVMAHFERPETPALLARLFEVVTLAGLAACLVLGALADDALRLIGYAKFDGVGALVMLVGPALLAQQLYVFLPGFAIAQRTGLQATISILSGVVVVGLNYLLIGALGIVGGALAMLLAAAFFILAWFVLADRYYTVPLRWKRLTGCVLLLASAAALRVALAPPWAGLVAALGITAALGLTYRFWWPALAALRSAARS